MGYLNILYLVLQFGGIVPLISVFMVHSVPSL
jgi:hypothetical protein